MGGRGELGASHLSDGTLPDPRGPTRQGASHLGRIAPRGSLRGGTPRPAGGVFAIPTDIFLQRFVCDLIVRQWINQRTWL